MKRIQITALLIACLSLASCMEPPPPRRVIAKVNKTYIDSGTKERGSSYMVATDVGVFEIDNVHGVVNADELYGQIVEGREYTFIVRGEKKLSQYSQQYPYIVSVNLYERPKKTEDIEPK